MQFKIPGTRWSFGTKSQSTPTETKSHYIPNLFEFLSQSGWGQVTAWQALRYYEQISPVAIGVDKVVDEFKALQPAIFDKSEQKYETSHTFLEFISHPNDATSGQDFLKNYGVYYKVTGQVYLLAIGNPVRPPLEMFVVQPQFVEHIPGADGVPIAYKVSSGNTGITSNTISDFTFKRKSVDGRFRYFNEAGDRELWYVKDFNPNASSTNFFGASVLNSIFYEIEQHLFSSRHNLSMLKRGGRLTGAMKTEGILSDPNYERLKEQIAKTIAGADNAGHIPLLEAGVDFVEMGKSNRDMDFAKLKAEIKETIFTRLDIPLPLINSSSMTMNNYQVAQVALYDGAVIPLSSKLFGELTLFLGGRFGLSEDQTLSADPATIPALQSRRLNNLLIQSKINVLSTDEKRAALGREELADGTGKVVYHPANLVAIGEDADTTGNRSTPASRQKFIEIMKEQKDVDGNRKWDDSEIEGFATDEGLV